MNAVVNHNGPLVFLPAEEIHSNNRNIVIWDLENVSIPAAETLVTCVLRKRARLSFAGYNENLVEVHIFIGHLNNLGRRVRHLVMTNNNPMIIIHDAVSFRRDAADIELGAFLEAGVHGETVNWILIGGDHYYVDAVQIAEARGELVMLVYQPHRVSAQLLLLFLNGSGMVWETLLLPF